MDYRIPNLEVYWIWEDIIIDNNFYYKQMEKSPQKFYEIIINPTSTVD